MSFVELRGAKHIIILPAKLEGSVLFAQLASSTSLVEVR